MRDENHTCKAVNAQSFAERISSAGNLMMTKDRAITSLPLLDMMVTISMNDRFMEHLRKENIMTTSIGLV